MLIVALVSVALLGFFPGMASDAQATQSKTYWSSASPIAITEWDAKAYSVSLNPDYTMPYLRLRNNGAYPIRITKILGGDGRYMSLFNSGDFATPPCTIGWSCNISDFTYLAPGEETYFASTIDSGKVHYNVPLRKHIIFRLASGSGEGGYTLLAASSICGTTAPYGPLVIKNFGFEYIVYIEGQQITKRQVGSKDLVIKCSQPPA